MVFVSNGPGELATWVKPLAERLHSNILMRPLVPSSPISLKLVLVPCPNATGKEADVAKKFGYFQQITKAKIFWRLLIRPANYGEWPKQGLVVFLGGDQFWSVLLSARLGYKHITYAEWLARWPYWNDSIAAMSEKVRERLPKRFRSRCKVVGDLMADLSSISKIKEPLPSGEWIALLPGSKKSKLCVGIPFFISVADQLAKLRPQCKFLLPVASTTNVDELKHFSSLNNPIARLYSSSIVEIKPKQNNQLMRKFITKMGTEINLYENQPAHAQLSQCKLALTTVGANTAELGALGVPMIVIVPTQHLSVMQAWDGIIGIIARIPGLKWCIGFLLTAWRLRNNGFLAWPNISAGRRIVPEKVGKIMPQEIAFETSQWLESPSRLKGQKEDLQSLRGKPGAVKALAKEIQNLISTL